MNEFEENIYKDIKNELLESVIDKRIDTYFVNRNELTHYYNVGKMIVDAQGGENKSEYGNKLIKKISERLTREIGKGYSTTSLKYMRQFYLFQKSQPVADQSKKAYTQLSWSHYIELLSLDDFNEMNYYINISISQHLSRNNLRERIKSKEYHRLDNKTKNKLINKEELDIYDNIKNPIYINTYENIINKTNIEEKALKTFILRDIDNFLKQLGDGFCYVENEYKILIGNKYNYIDLLLFNYNYNCFVVVELKVTKSKKDYLGQIMVYMNYIDKHVKKINQDKTIGIIVCRHDNKYLIEYSTDPRIRITTYKLV